MPLFQDRKDAGRRLAQRLEAYRGREDVLVLALPRGGVPVAHEVAEALDVPLDVFVVRKLGVPGQPELAMGAIATGGVRVLNEDLVRRFDIPQDAIDDVAERERRELERRETTYRGRRAPPDLRGKTIVLVDDGLATGATMRAAVEAVLRQDPGTVVVAVPTASARTCEEFRAFVDDVVCVETPEPFYGVGMWYGNFSQTTDRDVQEILGRPPGAAEA